MDFNRNISHGIAKTLKHFSDFVFISTAKLTLPRRDSYVAHVRSGIKPDTLAALTAYLHIATLFPDTILKKAEDDFGSFEN